MLSKSRRLARHDFPKDHREGFTVHTAHLSLRYTPKMPQQRQFSAVISKKIASKSPERHLWKRRIYEIIPLSEREAPLRPGFYVFFAKKDAPKLSYKNLTQEVEDLIGQIKR